MGGFLKGGFFLKSGNYKIWQIIETPPNLPFGNSIRCSNETEHLYKNRLRAYDNMDITKHVVN